MADVIQLDEGQDPPENEACYIVTRDPTGRFYIADSEVGFVRSFQASDYPISEAERTSTINRATSYADQHGIHAVYVTA